MNPGSDMVQDTLPPLPRELKLRFYYLEYPIPVPPGYWKDGTGRFVPMESMKLDHLKASLQLIRNDREAFLKAYKDGKYDAALHDALLPLIDAKQNELHAALIKGASL